LASVIPGRLDEGVADQIVAATRGNPLALLELREDSLRPRLPAEELQGDAAEVGVPWRSLSISRTSISVVDCRRRPRRRWRR
jgi:hypothetical protein